MKKVFLFSGKIHSGKNQLAEYVSEIYSSKGAKVVSDLFAADLKEWSKQDFKGLSDVLNNLYNQFQNEIYKLISNRHAYGLSDDGITDNLQSAEVILIGVSRSGKTPTSLYLAMQFGIRAANYPLIPEDLERMALPGKLGNYRGRIFGLTINPERLHRIRNERRPHSNYASIENCQHELHLAEKLMRREGIRWTDSTTRSVEEIATTVMQQMKLEGL
jgi:regulator of PEP synthase PpsR (kinase-PPPase family)